MVEVLVLTEGGERERAYYSHKKFLRRRLSPAFLLILNSGLVGYNEIQLNSAPKISGTMAEFKNLIK